MDKLVAIKIKMSDDPLIYSDSIPIGADATNITYSDDNLVLADVIENIETDLSNITTALFSDVGKVPKVKTVQNGKVVEWEFDEINNGSGNIQNIDWTDIDSRPSINPGMGTNANHRAQHVFGQYNISDSSPATSDERGNYIEIIGNGSSSLRSNARTLDWDGNEVLAGKLTVGTSPVNNMDVATKKYVDDAVAENTDPVVISKTISQSVTDWLDDHIDSSSNVVIDNSLTVTGAAADSKKVGDEITELKADLSQLNSDIHDFVSDTDFWELGAIRSSDGVDTSSTTRIRTKGMLFTDKYNEAIATGDYSFAVAAYNKYFQFVGIWSTNQAFDAMTNVEWVTYFNFKKYSDYIFRIVLRKTSSPSTALTVNDGLNVKFGKIIFSEAKNNERIISTTWQNSYGVYWENGQIGSSSILKVSSIIPIGENVFSIRMKTPVYPTSTTFGIAFYDENLQWIAGNALAVSTDGEYSSNMREIPVPSGAVSFRTVWFNDETTYGSWYGERITKTKPFYYICASDSSDADKLNADYICDGANDEVVIALALRRATYNKVNEVRFAQGTYVIDDFPYNDDSGIKIALPLGIVGNANYETIIKISGDCYGTVRKKGTANELYCGVLFKVSDTCYESLGDDTQYAIIGAATLINYGTRVYPGTKCKIEHMGFVLPDNQKKIICIDGWNMTALSFDDIHMMAVQADGDSTTGAIDPEDLHIGVDGCIGVRGLQGSCYGINNIWENAFAWGFETGFHVVGEHIVAFSLGTRFCNHGYKFGSLIRSFEGSLCHPNTLINCCDEVNFNLPVFGYTSHDSSAPSRQAVTLIDFNMEWQPAYSALGGSLATELNPGEAYGQITFENVATSGSNSVATEFWETGHGVNVKTTNIAHAISGTSSNRLSYTPQYLEQYFDTTLEKMLIYDGTNWIDMMGNAIA